MRWDIVGALAGFLVIVFILGRLWFVLVEALVGKVKRLFFRRRQPPAWHTFDEAEHKKDQ